MSSEVRAISGTALDGQTNLALQRVTDYVEDEHTTVMGKLRDLAEAIRLTAQRQVAQDHRSATDVGSVL